MELPQALRSGIQVEAPKAASAVVKVISIMTIAYTLLGLYAAKQGGPIAAFFVPVPLSALMFVICTAWGGYRTLDRLETVRMVRDYVLRFGWGDFRSIQPDLGDPRVCIVIRYQESEQLANV